MRFSFSRILVWLRRLFNLEEDKAAEEETIQSIRKGIDFKGTNLWILIFAIFIASIGLNVNSPAVIIGAMLISPLMGPITGVGLGVGINDTDLLRRSFINLGISVAISIMASTVYFLVTPLSEARSELLARTSPTVWDVLIAFFGGMAGVIAATRKEKSNVIPGVAIATALMPPLCTAGFGLATGNWTYLFGALYLFFINSVFICLSTFLIIRFLEFKKVEYVDKQREHRIRRLFWYVTLLTILPSIYLAYRLVKQTIFETSANNFIRKELTFPNAFPLRQTVNTQGRSIEVVLGGEKISDDQLEQARKKLPDYQLSSAKLVVLQSGSSQVNMSQLRNTVLQDLYERNDQVMKDKDARIRLLENEVTRLKSETLPEVAINREARALVPSLDLIVMNKSIYTLSSGKTDTILLSYVHFVKKYNPKELELLRKWLIARTGTQNVKMIAEGK